MILDLISSSNYNSFNIKLAHTLGLHMSIYINELLSIYEKAVRKQKTVEDYITLDREYIRERTTLLDEEQIELDEKLENAGIITKKDRNTLHIDTRVLLSIVVSNDEDLVVDLKQVLKTKKKTQKQNKEEQNIKFVSSYIMSTDSDIRSAYYRWIKSVIAKRGYISADAVIDCQQKLNVYANNNKEKQLRVLHVASMYGYIDIAWAVNKLSEQNSVVTTSTSDSFSTDCSVRTY